VADAGEKGAIEMLAATQTGMSTEEFRTTIANSIVSSNPVELNQRITSAQN
jgi:hypothetical protein